MITSISTNFDVNPISLKSYDSERIVVLQGMFTLDTANEEYLAAERHHHQGAASRKQAHP